MSQRRFTVLGLAAMLLAAMVVIAPPAGATGYLPERTYRVTVENLTDNQTFTPAVAATHQRTFRLFEEGAAASPGLQQLAENGGVPVLAEELAANHRVHDVAVVGEGPIAPGASATGYVTATRHANRLSVAGMLICTNDGFAGATALRLPWRLGSERTVAADAYDAGTEINTELYVDLVPPCDGMGMTGTSNPALAENGVVHGHPGIGGSGDLSEASHGWMDPAMRITVERVRLFEVTVTNLTGTQLLTPVVVATQYGRHRVFRPGAAASPGLQQLAENGGVPVLVDELTAKRGIGTVAVVGDGPIAPGASATAMVGVGDRAGRVSLAGMLICTNDGFAGVDSERLPRWIGHSRTFSGNAYDAGTEINTEQYADLVPPCDGMGMSGTSNPALAENGVVHGHAGIVGSGDLSEAGHGWMDPVIEVTVTRIG